LVTGLLFLSHLATWPLSHSIVEAAVSKGKSHQLDASEVNQGGGGTLSGTNFQVRPGSIGSVIPRAKLSGSTVQVRAGFLEVALRKRKVGPKPLDITVLYAKEHSLGPEIAPKTWQRDADPIFIWEAPAAGLEIAGYSYALDAVPDNTVDTTATSWNVAQDPLRKLTDGQHTFWVKAINTAGNAGEAISFDLWVDATPPTISSYSPQPASLLNTVAPSITASVTDTHSGVDPQAISLTINGSQARVSFDQTTGVVTASGAGMVKEGANRIELRVTDRVGNALTPLVWSFTADVTPPTGSVLINGGASMTTSVYVTLTFSASDRTSGVTRVLVSNDPLIGFVDEPYVSLRELWRLTAVRGPQKVYVKFMDQVGNVSEPVSDEIELALLAPETIILSGPAGLTALAQAQFTFTCPERDCVFAYAFDHQAWSEWTSQTTVSQSDLPFGNHYFKVKAAKETNGIPGIQLDEEDPTPAERTWIVGVEPSAIFVPRGAPIKLWRIE